MSCDYLGGETHLVSHVLKGFTKECRGRFWHLVSFYPMFKLSLNRFLPIFDSASLFLFRSGTTWVLAAQEAAHLIYGRRENIHFFQWLKNVQALNLLYGSLAPDTSL